MSSSLPDECESILISSEQIQSRVDELARDISDHYKTLLAEGETLALVPILSGSYIFAADLSRKLTVPNTVDFMALSSYRGSTSSSGEVKILMDTRDSVYGRHLLIIEDIIDTGYTLQFMRRLFETRGPKSINFAVLLTAPKKKRKVEVDVKWSGFNIGEKFVVGYGLDLASKYRNLPYIAELKLDVIKKFL